MIVKTQAVIISAIKYGESSRILKIYTRCCGIRPFIAKGVYSKKNKTNPLFSPMNILEIIFDNKNKSQLLTLKESRLSKHYISIGNNQQKNAIILFLSEILNDVLNEEEANTDLFDFITTSIEFFDHKETASSDFHLWFLFQLTRYLGFYPQIDEGAVYFDLTNGVSSVDLPSGVYTDAENLELLKKLSRLNFFEQSSNLFNQSQRKSLLDILLRYYEIHLFDFRWPKSLEVLNVVFE